MTHMKKTIIFDFDGTIADTFNVIIDLSNKLADEYGYRKIEDTDKEAMRSKTLFQAALWLRLPFWKIPLILAQGRKRMHRLIKRLKPVVGMEHALQELKKRGYHLGILSSNSSENIEDFLKQYNLEIFDFISAGVNIFGKSAALFICMKANGLSPQQVVYVGDEIRDVKAAHKVKIKSVAVTWGLNSKKLLLKHSPDFLIDKPEALVKKLTGQ